MKQSHYTTFTQSTCNSHTSYTQQSHNLYATVTQHNIHPTFMQQSRNTTFTQPTCNSHTTKHSPNLHATVTQHSIHTTYMQQSHNTTFTQPTCNSHTSYTQQSHNLHATAARRSEPGAGRRSCCPQVSPQCHPTPAAKKPKGHFTSERKDRQNTNDCHFPLSRKQATNHQ